ncbi:MAG: twin-arginine translocation pathway signal protein [Telmatospirillum sp.]|nr:twin-arginine translocation pathway signal protein [Telmatospirillum sp.]
MLSRRKFFAGVGGLVALETLGGLSVLRAASAQTADPAAPWRAAPAATHADWRVRAFGWAILAPNPHNRQPWEIVLDADGNATLRCAPDRLLPATDPKSRQITIGLGCFAELFVLAAAEMGVRVDVVPFPMGQTGAPTAAPVARFVRRIGAAPRDPLFAHVLGRRSEKRPFDAARPVPEAAFAEIAKAAGAGFFGTSQADRVADLRDIAWRAWNVEFETQAAHMESVALMRLGIAEVAANPDGISIYGPGLEPLVQSGALSRAAFATSGSQAQQVMVERYRTALTLATASFVWTVSDGDTAADAFAAGRQWMRLALAAVGQGLAVHPVSQALQEYPEMAPSYAALHEAVGVAAPKRIQMLARIGYLPGGANASPPTPRWPVESRIVGA